MSSNETGRAHRWYVIHTNPKQEERAESNLKAWSVETFAPKVIKQRAWPGGGDRQTFVRPLFPRYIFARFEAEAMLHNVRYTRGVHSVVSHGESPTAVDEEIIAIIRARVGPDGYVSLDEERPAPELEKGDRVVIESGAFSGLQGVFVRKGKDSDRVRVLLTVVNYQSHLVVERAAVKKVG